MFFWIISNFPIEFPDDLDHWSPSRRASWESLMSFSTTCFLLFGDSSSLSLLACVASLKNILSFFIPLLVMEIGSTHAILWSKILLLTISSTGPRWPLGKLPKPLLDQCVVHTISWLLFPKMSASYPLPRIASSSVGSGISSSETPAVDFAAGLTFSMLAPTLFHLRSKDSYYSFLCEILDWVFSKHLKVASYFSATSQCSVP